MGVEDPNMAYMDPDLETSNPLLRNTRCCFCFPCFPSRRSSSPSGPAWWQKIGSHPLTAADDHSHWWQRGVQAFKKLREWSEIVAGPKWKTFIRRFNRSRGGGSGNGRHGKFQYDALSYSLNFDEGVNGAVFDEDDDFGGFRDFSSRYAAAAGGKPLNVNKDVAVIS